MANSDLFRDEVIEARRQRLFGEVVLTQPLSTKILTGSIFTIIILVALWLTLGEYSRIETVKGILVTDQATTKIYAPIPGLVEDLSVLDGSYIRKGEPVATIKLDRQGEDGLDVLRQSASTIDERLRLTSQQIDIAEQKMTLERNRLANIVMASEAQSASLTAQIKLQEQAVASNRQIFEQIAKVVEQGFVSKVEFERRRQTLISSEQQLESLKQQRLSRQSDKTLAELQIAGLTIESAKSNGDILLQQSVLSQQRMQIRGERSYVITAPISGHITAIQTASGTMANGQSPLMVIIPQGSKLRAELYAPTTAIGFVKPGLETRILFDAFPYQRFGSFTGKISSVSKTVIDPREVDVPIKIEQAVYKITVKLGSQNVNGYGEIIPLQSGMTLSANIVLERQSFLNWILTPLNAVRRRLA